MAAVPWHRGSGCGDGCGVGEADGIATTAAAGGEGGGIAQVSHLQIDGGQLGVTWKQLSWQYVSYAGDA